MATKKETTVEEKIGKEIEERSTFNPLLAALRENDKKNLFQTNVTTAFIKTGFHLFDYYFGAVINIHDDLGKVVKQEPRLGQACGTFNLVIGNTGSGKSQPVSTMVPTPDGWKRMGDIKPGDYVYTYDRNAYTNVKGRKVFVSQVLWIFPQGELDVYEITLSNGRKARCSLDHLWEVNIDNMDRFVPVILNLNQILMLLNQHRDVYIPYCCKTYEHHDNSFTQAPGESCDELSLVEYASIVSVDKIGREECQCIYIDSPSHLYITDEFIITHNTTLASQMAANIIRQFKYANVIHFDCENRFDMSRAETITRLPSSYFDPEHGERYMIRNGMVGLDTIQEMIVKTYVSKMKLKDQLIVPSGYKDEFGRDIKIFEPTVIIIDSITTVINETFNPDNAKEANEAEKMRSNTDGARDAKTLKGFFKDILPMCKEANIIIYGINHINQNMTMNAFLPVAKQQNYLKQDESIPGGKTMLYYPFNIVKLTAKPSDDFTEEADGFAGHVVMVEPIKSSSNQSGNNSKGISFEMVFSHKYGFDSLRTMILYGREHGLIEGNRNRLKFKDDDSFTFTFKNIYEEKKEKPIWQNINKYIVPTLNEHLPFIEPDTMTFDEESLNY